MEIARVNVQNMVFRTLEMAGDGKQPTLAEASAMKVYSSEAATEVAMDAVQLFGGNGYMSEYRGRAAGPRRQVADDLRRQQRGPDHPRREGTPRMSDEMLELANAGLEHTIPIAAQDGAPVHPHRARPRHG